MDLDINWVKLWVGLALAAVLLGGVIAVGVNFNDHLKTEQMKTCVENGGQWKRAPGTNTNYECVK